MPETLRVFGVRPVVVQHEGWTIFIAVHDANHVRERSAWKLRLAHAHPDRHPEADTLPLKTRQARKFRNLKDRQEIWLRREVVWYEQFHLEPPPFGASKPCTPEGTLSACGPLPLKDSSSAMIWRMLLDGREHSAAEIETIVRRSVMVARAIQKLRERGAVITTMRSPAGLKSYRLDTPDGYRVPHDQALPRRLVALLADGAAYTTAELLEQLHTNPNTLGTAICRLRQRGAQISRTDQGGVFSYTMGQSA